MDYVQARLLLRVQVWVGLLEEPHPNCDRYRLANIVFEGVQFLSIEFPQAGSAFQHPGNIWFSYERTPPEVIPAALANALPPETQSYSLFIQDWLSYIHIAASDVSFSWSDAVDAEDGATHRLG
jgi:hypothetical protein